VNYAIDKFIYKNRHISTYFIEDLKDIEMEYANIIEYIIDFIKSRLYDEGYELSNEETEEIKKVIDDVYKMYYDTVKKTIDTMAKDYLDTISSYDNIENVNNVNEIMLKCKSFTLLSIEDFIKIIINEG